MRWFGITSRRCWNDQRLSGGSCQLASVPCDSASGGHPDISGSRTVPGLYCLTGDVDLNPAQLDALVAIAESGSFEAAARQLRLTPSAIRLHVEDQAYSQELLRSRDAVAAVTSDPSPVQGCTVEPLGSLRYVPAATPLRAADGI